MHSESSIAQEFVNVLWTSSPEAQIMEIPRDTIFPCCIICFLKIEENADNVSIVCKGSSDAGLKSHHVVSRGSAAPPSTLHASEVAEHVAVVVETVVD